MGKSSEPEHVLQWCCLAFAYTTPPSNYLWAFLHSSPCQCALFRGLESAASFPHGLAAAHMVIMVQCSSPHQTFEPGAYHSYVKFCVDSSAEIDYSGVLNNVHVWEHHQVIMETWFWVQSLNYCCFSSSTGLYYDIPHWPYTHQVNK